MLLETSVLPVAALIGSLLNNATLNHSNATVVVDSIDLNVDYLFADLNGIVNNSVELNIGQTLVVTSMLTVDGAAEMLGVLNSSYSAMFRVGCSDADVCQAVLSSEPLLELSATTSELSVQFRLHGRQFGITNVVAETPMADLIRVVGGEALQVRVHRVPATTATSVSLVAFIAMLVAVVHALLGTQLDAAVCLTRVRRKPLPTLIVFSSHFVILPALAYALALLLFADSPALTFSLFVLGCSPNGLQSNLSSFLITGAIEAAAAIQLVISPLSIGLMILWLTTAGATMVDEVVSIHLPWHWFIIYIALTFLPTALGSFVGERHPSVRQAGAVWGKLLIWAAEFVLLALTAILLWYAFVYISWRTVLAAVVLSMTGFLFGSAFNTCLRQSTEHAITTAVEAAIKNLLFSYFVLYYTLPSPERDIALAVPASALLVNFVALWCTLAWSSRYAGRAQKAQRTNSSHAVAVDVDSNNVSGLATASAADLPIQRVTPAELDLVHLSNRAAARLHYANAEGTAEREHFRMGANAPGSVVPYRLEYAGSRQLQVELEWRQAGPNISNNHNLPNQQRRLITPIAELKEDTSTSGSELRDGSARSSAVSTRSDVTVVRPHSAATHFTSLPASSSVVHTEKDVVKLAAEPVWLPYTELTPMRLRTAKPPRLTSAYQGQTSDSDHHTAESPPPPTRVDAAGASLQTSSLYTRTKPAATKTRPSTSQVWPTDTQHAQSATVARAQRTDDALDYVQQTAADSSTSSASSSTVRTVRSLKREKAAAANAAAVAATSADRPEDRQPRLVNSGTQTPVIDASRTPNRNTLRRNEAAATLEELKIQRKIIALQQEEAYLQLQIAQRRRRMQQWLAEETDEDEQRIAGSVTPATTSILHPSLSSTPAAGSSLAKPQQQQQHRPTVLAGSLFEPPPPEQLI